jgi:hypothetical protein
MALIQCSWCNHDIVNNETHGRINIDGPVKECRDCRYCAERRQSQPT